MNRVLTLSNLIILLHITGCWTKQCTQHIKQTEFFGSTVNTPNQTVFRSTIKGRIAWGVHEHEDVDSNSIRDGIWIQGISNDAVDASSIAPCPIVEISNDDYLVGYRVGYTAEDHVFGVGFTTKSGKVFECIADTTAWNEDMIDTGYISYQDAGMNGMYVRMNSDHVVDSIAFNFVITTCSANAAVDASVIAVIVAFALVFGCLLYCCLSFCKKHQEEDITKMKHLSKNPMFGFVQHRKDVNRIEHIDHEATSLVEISVIK
eukprot:764580_1